MNVVLPADIYAIKLFEVSRDTASVYCVVFRLHAIKDRSEPAVVTHPPNGANFNRDIRFLVLVRAWFRMPERETVAEMEELCLVNVPWTCCHSTRLERERGLARVCSATRERYVAVDGGRCMAGDV